MSRRMSRPLAAMAFLLLGMGVAEAQTPGDWVLARYRGGPHWYPGVIQSLSGGQVLVAYDDGDREALMPGNTRPYDWAIGRRVECNFRGAGSLYPGVISSLAGARIGINYDDGDREQTNTGRCRSQ